MGKLTRSEERARKVAFMIVRDTIKPADVRYQALLILGPLLGRESMARILVKAIPTLQDARVERRCLEWLSRLQAEINTIRAAGNKIETERSDKIGRSVAVVEAPAGPEVLRDRNPEIAEAENVAPPDIVATPPAAVPLSDPWDSVWAPQLLREFGRVGGIRSYFPDTLRKVQSLRNPEMVLARVKRAYGWSEIVDIIEEAVRRQNAPKPTPVPLPELPPPPDDPVARAEWELNRIYHGRDKNTATYRDFESRVRRLMMLPNQRRNPVPVLRDLAGIHDTTTLNKFLQTRSC